MATTSAIQIPDWARDAIHQYERAQERAAIEAKAAHTQAVKEARQRAAERLRLTLDQCEMPVWDFGANDLCVDGDETHWKSWYLAHDGYRFTAHREIDAYGLSIHAICSDCTRWLTYGPCWRYADVGRVFAEQIPAHAGVCPGHPA